MTRCVAFDGEIVNGFEPITEWKSCDDSSTINKIYGTFCIFDKQVATTNRVTVAHTRACFLSALRLRRSSAVHRNGQQQRYTKPAITKIAVTENETQLRNRNTADTVEYIHSKISAPPNMGVFASDSPVPSYEGWGKAFQAQDFGKVTLQF